MRPIIKMLTQQNFNPGDTSRIRYIVVHYAGATGSAKNQCKYFMEYRGASSHYFVDHNGDIYQSIEDWNVAWHCGAKVYKHPECRNANSIGIELCCRTKGGTSADSNDWYFEDATVESAANLVRYMMDKYHIPADRVVRHYDVTGKICPNPFIKDINQWIRFRNMFSKVDGWMDLSGKWKYFVSGQAATGWKDIDHYRNYFDGDGYLMTGWQYIDNDWYYFEEEGDYEGAMWASDASGKQHRFYA